MSNGSPRRVPRQVKAILTKELSIKTTIISRYAFTAVRCTMLNRHSAAAEGVFQFPVPADAYVTNFTIPADAAAPPETAEVFRAAASVPGRNRAVFLLTYEQLLRRRLGRYEHVTGLRPMQLVSRLSLDVVVVDHAPSPTWQVLAPAATEGAGPCKAELPVTTAIKQGKNFCRVTFSPNIVQQATIATNGNLGDFVIRYDVERELGIGDIQVMNGHFVHYFAPKDLPVVPKNVVFVIDTSASMLGTKIRQTKDALFTILRDLRPGDRFNFVSFSNKVKVWQPGRLVPVTPLNVRDAKKFIYTLGPTGGEADHAPFPSPPRPLPIMHRCMHVSLIIFLTDGRPTVGEVKSSAILGNARAAVRDKFCIFTLGMGDDVDYRLLERMALENCGMMRRIREDADASAMLKGFSSRPCSHQTVNYVTQNFFTNYFNGSEIVVAGKLTNSSAESLHVVVTASSSDKTVILEADVPLRQRQAETERHVKAAIAAASEGANVPAVPGTGGSAATGTSTAAGEAASLPEEDFVERLWGFLSIQEGLRTRLRSQTSAGREGAIRHATDLSLVYNFLTPLTSLEVEKPRVLPDGSMAPPPPPPPTPSSSSNTPGPTGRPIGCRTAWMRRRGTRGGKTGPGNRQEAGAWIPTML
ncbi:hypothetical protein CRUP_023129 [Coryphaenoides rupestris]|nr:hypothetical protein CRUP_023129 [Coryphaenoides rupestris]